MKMLWYKFLCNCVDPSNKQHYDFGISIPLIVGAYFKAGIIAEQDLQSPDCIKIILQAILDSGIKVKMSRCKDNGYTIMISLDYVNAVINPNPSINHQIYLLLDFPKEHDVSPDVRTIDFVAGYLYEKYGEYIRAHRFSCNGGVWGEFTEHEQKAFEKAIIGE